MKDTGTPTLPTAPNTDKSQDSEEAKMSMEWWTDKEDLLQRDKVNLAIKKHNQETFLINMDGRKDSTFNRWIKASVMWYHLDFM